MSKDHSVSKLAMNWICKTRIKIKFLKILNHEIFYIINAVLCLKCTFQKSVFLNVLILGAFEILCKVSFHKSKC